MLQLVVDSRERIADTIVRFAFVRETGGPLPAFTPGAHIDLQLPGGMVRSYSLLDDAPGERYAIAVANDQSSRGGSRWIHDHLHRGMPIAATVPRNNFRLIEDAPRSVFIAGGIGITPIKGMVSRLASLGRDWQLLYCARSRAQAAFVGVLADLGGRVRFHFDDEAGGVFTDIARTVAEAGPDTHLYCCGPAAMLADFEQATAGAAPERVHVEYFSAPTAPVADGGYTVRLARSGRELDIRPGQTIIDAMMLAGIDAPYSCLEGVCGTCETRVLDGQPDHRDLVLSRVERESNRTMMICCSGAKSARLVLDL